MRIHHLNCISTCPLGGKWMDASAESILHRGHLTNHCLLIEADRELILVDTGLGLLDVRNPRSRLSRFFLELVRPEFRDEMTAHRQIESMGFDPQDVRHILLTHLDFDHAGGLDDFPHATVHLLQAERDYAAQQKTWLDRQRFRPRQWSTQAKWKTYEPGEGETWFGFNRVQALHGISGRVASDLVMIPLTGHTFGHAGIAVKQGDQWLFQTGDAYFFHGEMEREAWCTPGLEFYQTLMEKDRKSRLWNQLRLRNLRKTDGDQIEIFCAHDVEEFERLAGRSARLPAEQILTRPMPLIADSSFHLTS